MPIPHLRNPGPWSFAIFAAACALVITLRLTGAPEAGRLAAELVAILVAAFGAKSALASRSSSSRSSSSSSRPPMPTWPDLEPPTDGDDRGSK